MNRLHGVLLITSIAVLCCAGCTWSRERVNAIDFHTKAATVVPGTTKSSELATILGTPPNATLDIKGGKEVYVYNFGDSKTKGLTLIFVNIMKTSRGEDSAYFVIDSTGVVEEWVVSTNSQDLPWEWWAFGD